VLPAMAEIMSEFMWGYYRLRVGALLHRVSRLVLGAKVLVLREHLRVSSYDMSEIKLFACIGPWK